MEIKVELREIELKIGDHELRLSQKDAKELYDKLGEVVNENSVAIQPVWYYPTYPSCPYQPSWSYNDNWSIPMTVTIDGSGDAIDSGK